MESLNNGKRQERVAGANGQAKETTAKHWLWRAVDQDGFVLEVLVQSRRDKKAAKRLFRSSSIRKLFKKQGRAPRVLVTDKLKSYAAAKREIMPGVEHRQLKGLNNRAENSHQPGPAPRADHKAVQVAAAGSTLPFRP
jgi:transposase-like protein